MSSSIHQETPVFPASRSVAVADGADKNIADLPHAQHRENKASPSDSLAALMHDIHRQNKAMKSELKEMVEDGIRSIVLTLRFKDLKLLNTVQVATILGVSVYTVRRWLDSGKMVGQKHGVDKQARWRIPRAEVEKFEKKYVNEVH